MRPAWLYNSLSLPHSWPTASLSGLRVTHRLATCTRHYTLNTGTRCVSQVLQLATSEQHRPLPEHNSTGSPLSAACPVLSSSAVEARSRCQCGACTSRALDTQALKYAQREGILTLSLHGGNTWIITHTLARTRTDLCTQAHLLVRLHRLEKNVILVSFLFQLKDRKKDERPWKQDLATVGESV